MAPKISVIVPLYKTERFVEKCVRSIMEQTFKDIEIICVDDCSPDDSTLIVRRLAAEDSRIQLIRHMENRGLGGARNTGILHARAPYIASVDSDDYIDPKMLEALYDGTQDGLYDVVVCGFERVDEAGKVLSKHLQAQKVVDPIPEDQDPYKLANPAFWNKLWRTSLYTQNDIFFPNHIYYQDAATTPRVFAYAKNINFIGGAYYKYLVRADSVTNKVSDKHKLDKYRELDFVKDFFVERGLYGKYHEAFRSRVFDTYHYHFRTIVENNPKLDGDSIRYLRYLLLMRESYLGLDDTIRSMTVEELKAAFQDGSVDIHRLGLQKGTISSGGFQPRIVRPWSRTPDVMVLTLHSGENEFTQSKQSLESQSYTRWTHKVFSGLGNVESHRVLYEEIMANSGRYHIFLKLDADMVFADEAVLSDIVNRFSGDPQLDHFIVACDDWMTGKQIIGVHAFSNRVVWERTSEGLFVDPSPKRPGKRVIIENPEKTFFFHSPDPSPFQAFHFGAHRALKLTQRHRPYEDKRPDAMQIQWDVFFNVWQRFRETGDTRLGLALLACDLVVSGQLGEGVHDYKDPELLEVFRQHEKLTMAEILSAIEPIWGTLASRRSYFARAVGDDGLRKIEEDRLRRKKERRRSKQQVRNPASDDRIRMRRRYRMYQVMLSPFIDEKLKRKLEKSPTAFFLDARHPALKFGRWLHRKDLR
ncbi:glycosyltransferase family 2 protein [Sinorhizobium meliloti]|uniref:glycosyltransferase family 2 protein n=1 Tax=Rhizobium meliloti TaxID=382 RepID=UPI000FDC98FB|nr:glycosyltransferase family 2 protein [Sinorhizobium meliloti]RVN35647.1 glycosyltransferase [Sinorhizobium meliloti]